MGGRISPVTREDQAVGQKVEEGSVEFPFLGVKDMQLESQARDAATSRGTVGAAQGFSDEAVAGKSTEEEDPITRAMYRIIASDLRGLSIRQYNCYPEEIEVIATIDENVKQEDLEMQLQLIAPDVRVRLSCGDFSDFPFSAGQLGLGDKVGVDDRLARVTGYVLDNDRIAHAFTVGHLFTIGGKYHRNCIIKASGELEISGKLVRCNVLMDYIDAKAPVFHDMALIKIDHPVNVQNVLKVNDSPRHPKMYDNVSDMKNQIVYLSLTTDDGNSKRAKISCQQHSRGGQLLCYTLVSETGGPISGPGDSGTLVCSIPLNNNDKLNAFAYIFAGSEQESYAMPLLPQIEHLLAGLDHGRLEFFSECTVRVVDVID